MNAICCSLKRMAVPVATAVVTRAPVKITALVSRSVRLWKGSSACVAKGTRENVVNSRRKRATAV